MDGVFTAGNTSLVFEEGTGVSVIADNQTLYNWAVQAGLLQAPAAAGNAKVALYSAPSLTGVQTLPVGTARHVAALAITSRCSADLWATLQQLDHQQGAGQILAGIQFEVRDTGNCGVPAETADCSLTWAGVETESNGKLSASSCNMSWSGTNGTGSTEDPGLLEFNRVQTDDISNVKGIWQFSTLLAASDGAKWTADSTLAGFYYEFDETGWGKAIYYVDLQEPQWWWSYSGIADPESQFEQARALGGMVTTIPSDASLVPLYAGKSGVYPSIALEALDVTGQSPELVGRIQAICPRVSIGWFGVPSLGEQPQRTTFQFSGGILRKINPLASAETAFGDAGFTMPSSFAAERWQIVFNRLDLHSQLLLDTDLTALPDGEQDGQGDPDASIAISGPWTRGHFVPVAINEVSNGSLRAKVGDQVSLTAVFPLGTPPGVQFFWSTRSRSLNDQLAIASSWSSQATITFTMPDVQEIQLSVIVVATYDGFGGNTISVTRE